MPRRIHTAAFVSLLLSLVACEGRDRAMTPSPVGPRTDAGVADPRCQDANFIIPGNTCIRDPDLVCPGSCGQSLSGVVGVGLSSCRCMDPGTGLGKEWVCDVSRCASGDAGVEGDAGARDAGALRDPADECLPARYEVPSDPGCTAAQRDEIMRFRIQADYNAFVADPVNMQCYICLSDSGLACATSMGCSNQLGDLDCCLDERCLPDDTACRDVVAGGECRALGDAFVSCFNSSCPFNPWSPPPECFP